MSSKSSDTLCDNNVEKAEKVEKVEEDIEEREEPEDQDQNWVDEVIKLFQVPEQKRHLYDDTELLSNEESLERITNLLLLSSFLLCLVSITLLSTMDFSLGPKTISIPKKLPARVPHIFIIYQGGLHIDFSTDETISPSKSFPITLRKSVSLSSLRNCQLPHQDTQPNLNYSAGYLAYANDKKIYIFYTDGKKDLTYIDIGTGKHRTISNTAYGSNLIFGSGVRVGDQFFMTGDRINQCHSHGFLNYKSKCYIWKEKREKLDSSKKAPVSLYDNTCFASYNRTHFLRVGRDNNDKVVNMIELSNLKEVYLTNIPLFTPHPGYSHHRKTCSIVFNKNQDKKLVVLAKHHIKDGVVEHTLDLKSMTWSRSATNLKHFGSLVVAKGMWFYFNVLNQDGDLGSYYDTKMNTWQNLEIETFIANVSTDKTFLLPIVTVPYLG